MADGYPVGSLKNDQGFAAVEDCAESQDGHIAASSAMSTSGRMSVEAMADPIILLAWDQDTILFAQQHCQPAVPEHKL